MDTAPARSAWTPERVLQAACDGQITVTEDLFEVHIYVDGKPATNSEAVAVVDLITSDQLVMIGRRVACTANGRDQMARWARYKPLRSCQRNNTRETKK